MRTSVPIAISMKLQQQKSGRRHRSGSDVTNVAADASAVIVARADTAAGHGQSRTALGPVRRTSSLGELLRQ
ncbi:hypothetical protein FJT64_011781 [Amphibalanus amphitrite]|uniref:Uncharacterized protein n=1 Tax=Amphibalanus amphitrite TaxID=1232801 RepID=A0A6A4VEL1_AMPAM|nr:hypothetical protein FJT64_011781 [Amphibalanus amphitrite]